MRIPDEKIEEVRSASNIVDVISSSVRLKKRGKSYIGLCPFHQEKTPSFTVSLEKQMYHCFGCGAGGNVFTFVMETEKVSFIEAVRTLADRAGVALPAEGGYDRTQATENEALYNACRVAGLHFHANFDTVEGKLAFEYFRHRGFTVETIRKFGLGYAMNSWDDLLRHAERQGITGDILERAGLVARRDDGTGYYDRFRGRAMFPVFSPSGRTIGFGARKLREDDTIQGKYINSPETPIYNKSRTLYGLFQAKETIREKESAVLVEGYADLITLFQSGVRNVVASSGTALTDEQIQLVARYAPSITIVYDADSAGSKAALRGVDLVIERGLEVRVATLPEGDDPDSFVRSQGPEAFRALIDQAVSFLDFKAAALKAEGLFATAEGQTRAVRSIVETIARMKDELKRTFYIKSVAEKYDIYESVLYRELERQLGHERSRARFETQEERRAPETAESSPEQTAPPPVPLTASRRDLLKLMLLQGRPMATYVFSSVSPERFGSGPARALADLLFERAHEGPDWDTSTLVDAVGEESLRRFMADLVVSRHEISRGWEVLGVGQEPADPWVQADRCLELLRREELDAMILENQRSMKSAAARGEPVREFLERHQILMQEKKQLDRKD